MALDFENPVLPLSVGFVPTSNGLPGWTAYQNNGQQSFIFYDTGSLGGAAISLHDSASGYFQPVQGNYSVFLQGSGGGPPRSAAIGQTGQHGGVNP